jgi:hypothetical protein
LKLQQELLERDLQVSLLKPHILYPGVQPWEHDAWGSDGEIAQAVKVFDIDKEGTDSVFLFMYDMVYICKYAKTYETLLSHPFPMAVGDDEDGSLIHRVYLNSHNGNDDVTLESVVEVLVRSIINAREPQQ